MTDLIAKAVALFQSRSAITDLTASGRIYDTELPSGYCEEELAATAIVIREAPDTVYAVESPTAELSLEVECWGQTDAIARSVFRALYDGLHGQMGLTVAGLKWHSVWIDGGAQPKIDQQTSWLFVLCTVRALVITT